MSGNFLGDSGACEECLGACCFIDVTCIDTFAADCAEAGGDFQGQGAPCAAVTCPAGACCFEDFECVEMLGADCTAKGGDFQGEGQSCESTECPGTACCFPDDTCEDLPADTCLDLGGVHAGPRTECGNTVCPLPVGACCRFDSPCMVISEIACKKLPASVYLGDGTDCSACLGACCNLNPAPVCGITTQVLCSKFAGSFEGFGSDCSECPGRCCFPDGSCTTSLIEEECLAKSGVFAFDEFCPYDNCPDPCPGDANTDGITDVDDIIVVIMDWNCGTGSAPPGPCDGDVNDDGVTDVDDLVQVVLGWGCEFGG